MDIRTVGVVGLGSFGAFIARNLRKDGSLDVYGYDNNASTLDGVKAASLAEVAACDAVILAVPLKAYDDVLPALRGDLPATSLLIDICSVKVYPEQTVRRHLPDHTNLLFCHPLFGPQSAANGLAGHSLIVTGQHGQRATAFVEYCRQELELQITEVSAEVHDRTMAQVQALTFFLASGLAGMELPEPPFKTPSYAPVEKLLAFYDSHSQELFDTVQQGNPFAADIRQSLIDSLQAYHQALKAAGAASDDT
jgi:prephenate dehydrogenase